LNLNAMNINAFKQLIENRLTAVLGRQVKLGDLSMSPLSSTVDARDLTVADDPQFSSEPFITATVIHIGVQMRPLIFQQQIFIESLEIEAPQIHLVRAANGAWNLSTLGRAATQTQPQNQPAIPAFTVDSLRIKNGHATLDNLAPAGTPLLIDQIDLTVSNFGFAKEFSFTLGALFPEQATLNITGKAGPINSQDPVRTNFDMQLALHRFDPVATGFVKKAAGISVLADIDAHAVSDGAAISSNGTLHTQHLQLRPDATPAAKPVDITYNVTHSLSDNTGQLVDAAFQTGTVSAHLNGTYAIHPDNIAVDLKLAGDNLPINELQSLLPAVGVKPPNVPQSGTLTTHMTIVGPLQALVIGGAVEFANIRLPGFKLGSQQKN
jgi:AsmA protein